MVEIITSKKKLMLKTLVLSLGFLTIALIVYTIALPLYPELKYRFLQAEETPTEQTLSVENVLPVATSSDSAYLSAIGAPLTQTELAQGNRVIIKKIGVDVPIVEGQNGNWALNRGAWRMPQTSTPDKGSNTVISAHRFRYLPPSNLTFYLLDKLAVGDEVLVIWENQEYRYIVSETKIVPPTAMYILNASEKPILTLFTCDPIWTQDNRLVVIGELQSK